MDSLKFATSTTDSIASTSGDTTSGDSSGDTTSGDTTSGDTTSGGTNVQSVIVASTSSVGVADPSTASISAGTSGGTNVATTSPVRNDDDGNDSKLSEGSSSPMSPAKTPYDGQVEPVTPVRNDDEEEEEEEEEEEAQRSRGKAGMQDENGNWCSKPRCDRCLIGFDSDAALQSHFTANHDIDISVTLGAAAAGAGAAGAGAAGAGAAVVWPPRCDLSVEDVSNANILLSLQTTPDSSRDSSLPGTTSPTESQPPNCHPAASTPPAPTHTPSSLTPTPTAGSTSPAPNVASTLPSVEDNVDTAGVSSAGAPLSSKSLADPASSSSSPHHLQPRDTAAASPTSPPLVSAPENSRSCSPLPELPNPVNATGVLIVGNFYF